MASSFVFYKFKSQREPSRIAFDGTAISVFDLKKEIIAENRMGKGADFDFAIYHADTEEGTSISPSLGLCGSRRREVAAEGRPQDGARYFASCLYNPSRGQC